MAIPLQYSSPKVQTAWSIGLIALVTGTCFVFSQFIDYRVVAFIYLLTLSILAVIADIIPVLIAATISALLWNLLFIEPRFSFRIGSIQDGILFSTYFLISFINAIFTYRIRKTEKQLRVKEEKAQILLLYNTIFSSLSHELKTPIATILGSADMLSETGSTLNEKQRKELVSQITQAAIRLNHQTENLLNMSRLESGNIRPKKDWCDIGELIYSITGKLQPFFHGRQLLIKLDKDLPFFKLDHFLVEQALYNLLYNACLYTPDNTMIKIEAWNMNEKYVSLQSSDVIKENNLLKVEVEDNGPGFPGEELEKVFDKFYRLKNIHAGGTGLGLSIAKGFIEANGGSIQLENIPHGCRFTILIPAEVSYLNKLKNE